MGTAAFCSLRQESIKDMIGDFLVPFEKLGCCAVMAVTLLGGPMNTMGVRADVAVIACGQMPRMTLAYALTGDPYQPAPDVCLRKFLKEGGRSCSRKNLVSRYRLPNEQC